MAVTHTLVVPSTIETLLTGRAAMYACVKGATVDRETAKYAMTDPPSCKRCVRKLWRIAHYGHD